MHKFIFDLFFILTRYYCTQSDISAQRIFMAFGFSVCVVLFANFSSLLMKINIWSIFHDTATLSFDRLEIAFCVSPLKIELKLYREAVK